MRRFLEGHHDLAGAGAQLLAGAQIEGRAGPAPVGDAQLQCDKAFRARGGVARILKIAGAVGTGLILAAHDILGRDRFQRADHLQLFVAHRVRVEMIGRLHRDQAQQLHHVVLHHVADGAGMVVIFAAPAHAHGFGNRDLDMVDILRVPQRLEQDIGETHGHQVLDRFLAQIMVDAIDLVFAEMPRQRGVQFARGRKVAAKGLFHHDPAVGIGDAVIGQSLGDIAEKRGGDREIEGMDRARAHPGLQFRPAAGAARIDGDIAQRCQKGGKLGLVFVRADEFVDRRAHLGAEGLVVLLGARRADDPRRRGHLPRHEAPIQARHDLAPGKIAGRAKDHQIEVFDRNDARNHGCLLTAEKRISGC